MDLFFDKALSFTRFTTNKVAKSFLPRRIGLGYRTKHEKLNREVIKPCLKARMDNRRRDSDIVPELDTNEADEETGRSSMVKRRNRPSPR